MTTLNKLRRWLLDFRATQFEPPKTIPISRAEVMGVMNDDGPFVQDVAVRPEGNRIFGLDAEEHDFAPAIRDRRLQVPVGQYLTEFPANEFMRYNVEMLAREGANQIRLYVLRDQTKVRVTFDWDIFAPLKKLLHIKPRQRTAEIDCTVLYPYCKVQLPHNRHYFHCK